tara:strand:- start:387 stop:662 length:276 start_codon:yes stop_codon:yes gene_type:complete
MNFFSNNKVCQVIPNEKKLRDEKIQNFRKIIDYYNDVRSKNNILLFDPEFYNEIVKKGEYFKSEMEKFVSEEEYKQFLKYLAEIKNMKHLF